MGGEGCLILDTLEEKLLTQIVKKQRRTYNIKICGEKGGGRYYTLEDKKIVTVFSSETMQTGRQELQGENASLEFCI